MSKYLKSNAFHNLLAVLIGLLFAAILVVVIDKLFGWGMNLKGGRSNFFANAPDVDGLGWSAQTDDNLKKTSNGYSIRHKAEAGDDVIFDVTYNFDEFYRRAVPGRHQGSGDQFILFFGDSQTFGEGVSDTDTIPALVQQGAPGYQVYNYAYKGYGPHQMLKKLESNSLVREVPEYRGIAFYQYFGFHVPRTVGTMAYISWAGGGAPYYQLDSNAQPQYQGSFATGRFSATLFYWLLGKSAIAKHYGVELPSQLTKADYDLVCRIIAKSRKTFLNQYPGSRFIVLVGMTNGEGDPVVEKCLKREIEYVDLRNIHNQEVGLEFPHDGHFTPKATRLIARHLLPVISRE